jgi:hypothetical protein
MTQETGFVADGADRHSEGIKAEFAAESSDLRQRLRNRELDSETRSQLEKELADLEREHAIQAKNARYSLF